MVSSSTGERIVEPIDNEGYYTALHRQMQGFQPFIDARSRPGVELLIIRQVVEGRECACPRDGI
jgi:hypothetical protein